MSEKHAQNELSQDNCVETRRKSLKNHVAKACINCKKAHLACDLSRPCQRCIQTDKADICHDITHKKRGRPKIQRTGTIKKPKVQYVKGSSNYTPELVHSSFSTTQPEKITKSIYQKEDHIMSIVLSMDLRCSRVSDESLEFFGFYPQEFSHRSLYDFLLSDQSGKLSEIHERLLDNAIHQDRMALPTTPRSSSDKFFSVSPVELLKIANGSQTFKSKLKFCGKRHMVEAEVRFYLGGGLGADLFNSQSLEQLYIVCILSTNQTYTKHGDDDHDLEQNSINYILNPIMLQPSALSLLSASLASPLALASSSLNSDDSIYSLVDSSNTSSRNSFIDDITHIESPLSAMSEDDDHHHSSSSNGSTPYTTGVHSIMSELLDFPSNNDGDIEFDQLNDINNIDDLYHFKTTTSNNALVNFQPTIALQNLDDLNSMSLGLSSI